MTTHKRKKNTKMRAQTTHGWGAMKKHRGAGNRGGRGNAGTGKRGDARKPVIWKDKKYFGKNGFDSKSRMPDIISVSIKTLEDRADNLVRKGFAKSEGGAYVIDLSKLGYNKLLSNGNPTKKLMITTAYATKNAVEKIKKAGGQVTLTAPKPKAGKNDAKADKKEPAKKSA